MINAYCLGANNVDIYRHIERVFAGGIPFNVAVNIVRTGNKASVATIVGNDELGKLQIDSCVANGVDTSHIQVRDGQTGWCWIKVKDGDRVFGVSGGTIRDINTVDADMTRPGLTGEYDLIYINAEAEYTEEALELMREGDVPIVRDFTNYWKPEDLAAFAGIVDYYYMSFDGHEENVEEVLKTCVHEYGAKMAVGTMGMNGSLVYNGRRFYRQKAFAIKPVDTLGAGDTFLSTFTSLYFNGRKLLRNYENVTGWGDGNEHVMECEDKLIEHALSYAAMGGAYACMSEGCYGFSIPYDHSLISRSNIDIEKAVAYFDAL